MLSFIADCTDAHYSVWSAIGIMLSVHLSVCNAVHCSSQGGVHG